MVRSWGLQLVHFPLGMLSWRRGSEEPECPASTVCIMLQIARLPYMAKGYLVAQLVKNLPACRKPGLDSWVGKILWRREQLSLQYSWASLVTQKVKNPPAMWETWVRSLGWEDPLEKGMATHSTSLAWTIPWTEEPGGLQCMGLHRVGQATFTYMAKAWALVQPWEQWGSDDSVVWPQWLFQFWTELPKVLLLQGVFYENHWLS